MRDKNGELFMTFEQQSYFCNISLSVPLCALENIAMAVNPVEYMRLRVGYATGFHSVCVYRAWLTLLIYENDFMRKIFQWGNDISN